MAIFPKKEICPICGRAIKGDVRIRIKDNVELCKVCSSEIEMDAAMIPNQTVEDIKAHLAYREENRRKMEQFEKAWGAEAGAYVLRADTNQCVWYCTNDRSDRNPPLYDFESLTSAVYLEDGEPAAELKTGLKEALFGEKVAPKLVQSMKIIIDVDNPYIHRITVETLGPGKGMTTGTMQYKMNRKAIQSMMNCLLSIQKYAAGETEDLPVMTEIEGEDQAGIPDMQQEADISDIPVAEQEPEVPDIPVAEQEPEVPDAPAAEQGSDDPFSIPGTDEGQQG